MEANLHRIVIPATLRRALIYTTLKTFIRKAHSLLITIFLGDLPIQVERMSGESYNCVVRWWPGL